MGQVVVFYLYNNWALNMVFGAVVANHIGPKNHLHSSAENW